MKAKYQRKPDEVDAVRWTGENEDEIKDFIGDHRQVFTGHDRILIPHTGGIASAVVGEWIVKHPNGGLTVLSDPTFSAMWLAVPDTKDGLV